MRILPTVRYARPDMAGLVLHRLRTRVKPLVPRRLRPFATLLAGRIAARVLAGDAVSCPCCGVRLKRFVAYPSLYCPRCGSYERHRLLALHLERRPELLAPPLKLLHVSPDRALEPVLARDGIDRVSIDLNDTTVDLQMDVEHLTFEDESFDAVLALAVLDDVGDQQRALAELRRVLRPGGVAVFQVAVPEQPLLVANLASSGFEAEIVRATDFGPDAITRHALHAGEETYVCRMTT
jgi:SAM-dependent methyltransferase